MGAQIRSNRFNPPRKFRIVERPRQYTCDVCAKAIPPYEPHKVYDVRGDSKRAHSLCDIGYRVYPGAPSKQARQ